MRILTTCSALSDSSSVVLSVSSSSYHSICIRLCLPLQNTNVRLSKQVIESSAGDPRTERFILRPSVTSSGRTLRKSRMAAWLCTSLPRVETTVGKTSFQVLICIASIAKQTQSCTRTGLGPAANFFKSSKSWSRRVGKSPSGTCVARSYVICKCVAMVSFDMSWDHPSSTRKAYLSLQCRRCE